MMVYEKHVWGTEVITSDHLNRIEAQIDELSNHIWVIGDHVWITHNATYDGSTWGSIDDTKFRLALRLDRSTGKLEILHGVPWRVSGAIYPDGQLVLNGQDIKMSSQFVDIPGAPIGTNIRKTWTPNVPVARDSSVDVVSFNIPENYSWVTASNARIVVTAEFSGWGTGTWGVRVTRAGPGGGTEIGSASATPESNTCTLSVDTTGGFLEDHTIIVTVYTSGGVAQISSVTQVQYASKRATGIPVYKVFAEESWP
jgi:hypothetical protein